MNDDPLGRYTLALSSLSSDWRCRHRAVYLSSQCCCFSVSFLLLDFRVSHAIDLPKTKRLVFRFVGASPLRLLVIGNTSVCCVIAAKNEENARSRLKMHEFKSTTEATEATSSENRAVTRVPSRTSSFHTRLLLFSDPSTNFTRCRVMRVVLADSVWHNLQRWEDTMCRDTR